MRIVSNTGSDRVIDLVRPWLAPTYQLDMATPELSLFAFAAVLDDVMSLRQARLLLPQGEADLAVLGSDADRALRNGLRSRWLARCFAEWLRATAEVRMAPGLLPQGMLVLRDGGLSPQQVVVGPVAFSTAGLGTAPGNPLSLIQASDTADEASQLSQWFDVQWRGLPDNPAATR